MSDIEVKLYNDIMSTIEKIEGTLSHVLGKSYTLTKEAEDAIFLTAVWAKDLKDKFIKYANRHYE